MPGTLTFTFDKALLRAKMHAAARAALERLKDNAHDWWLVTVPVQTGRLRDSWYAVVIETTTGVALVFGASAPYAIYVELGTSVMHPRAPLRTVAGEITPFLPIYFREELAAVA